MLVRKGSRTRRIRVNKQNNNVYIKKKNVTRSLADK